MKSSAEEAAHIGRCSTATIYRLTKKNALASERFGPRHCLRITTPRGKIAGIVAREVPRHGFHRNGTRTRTPVPQQLPLSGTNGSAKPVADPKVLGLILWFAVPEEKRPILTLLAQYSPQDLELALELLVERDTQ
jgi:hypothetical protein